MEFIELAAILGGLLSALSAYMSFRSTKERLEVEKELDSELHKYFMRHYAILKTLEEAKRKGSIKIEVNSHLKDYEELMNNLILELPDEKRLKIYPAIKQNSERGKVAYISKLVLRSLANA